MTWKAVVKRNAATTHLAAINKSLRNTKKGGRKVSRDELGIRIKLTRIQLHRSATNCMAR